MRITILKKHFKFEFEYAAGFFFARIRLGRFTVAMSGGLLKAE